MSELRGELTEALEGEPESLLQQARAITEALHTLTRYRKEQAALRSVEAALPELRALIEDGTAHRLPPESLQALDAALQTVEEYFDVAPMRDGLMRAS